MPGLIGFAGSSGGMSEAERLAAMAHALEPDDRFLVDLYQEPGLGLGHVAHPFTGNGGQPVWDEAGLLGVVMEGEVYNRGDLLSLLPEDERPLTDESDAGLLMRLFRAHGAAFASAVNGAFVAAFWDRPNGRLTLVNDRLGLHPLYWAQVGDRLLFASGVRALLADPTVPRCADRLAIAQFLTFDHMLGTHTHLEDVHLLTPGSVLTWEDGQIHERSYWTPVHPEYYDLKTEVAWMDEFDPTSAAGCAPSEHRSKTRRSVTERGIGFTNHPGVHGRRTS